MDSERFIAVGHVVGDMSCFHRPEDQGNGDLNSSGRGASSNRQKLNTEPGALVDMGPHHPCDKSQPWDGSQHERWEDERTLASWSQPLVVRDEAEILKLRLEDLLLNSSPPSSQGLFHVSLHMEVLPSV